MRGDLLTDPVDGLDDALGVVDGFDDTLVHGLIRLGQPQVAALTALADVVSGTPLGQRTAEATEKVLAGSVADEHLATLAAARSALLGAAHDALLTKVDEATGRNRAPWPTPPTPVDVYGENLLAAAQSWLTDLALAGWRGIDHDLIAGSGQVLAALLADVRMRRLAVLLDGFAAELRASCPGAAISRVPVRRWADLWSRAVVLCQPGAGGPADATPVSGRLLPLGVDLHEHATAVQAQVHFVLEPVGGAPACLVRASASATKVDTIIGAGVWQLLRRHSVLFEAAGTGRAIDITEIPLTTGGDLVWDESHARLGAPAEPFATARVQLAGATAAPIPPLQRHPVRIAEPVLLEGYAVEKHEGEITFTVAGLALDVEVDRLPAASPLTPALVGSSTACIGLLRWDASRWRLQPLAVETTVKRAKVAVHAGGWAGGATDTASTKAEAAAADAVSVLRERAGRLLRA